MAALRHLFDLLCNSSLRLPLPKCFKMRDAENGTLGSSLPFAAVVTQSADCNNVQGAVRRLVSATVQSMALGIP